MAHVNPHFHTDTHTPPTGHTLKCLYPRSLAEAHKSASIPDIHPPSRAQHSGDGTERPVIIISSSLLATRIQAQVYRNMNMLVVYMLIPHEAIGCIHLQLVTEWSGLRWPALYITLLLVLKYLLSATANTLQEVTHKHSPLKF